MVNLRDARDRTARRMDMGGAMDDVYPSFTQAFETVSYSTLKHKLLKFPARKAEKWMRTVISGTK